MSSFAAVSAALLAAFPAYALTDTRRNVRLPAEDYRLLRKELRLHDAALGRRPFLIAANKSDLPESAKNMAALRTAARRAIFPISAKNGEGLPELISAIRKSLPA